MKLIKHLYVKDDNIWLKWYAFFIILLYVICTKSTIDDIISVNYMDIFYSIQTKEVI